MEIAEAERKTFDELKSNYRQASFSNYHDFVQMGNTPEPLYNMVRYNTVLDITRIRVGPQMAI